MLAGGWAKRLHCNCGDDARQPGTKRIMPVSTPRSCVVCTRDIVTPSPAQDGSSPNARHDCFYYWGAGQNGPSGDPTTDLTAPLIFSKEI